MYVEVVLDGQHYTGKAFKSYSLGVAEVANEHAKTISTGSYQLDLSDGGVLVLDSYMAKRAHFIFHLGKPSISDEYVEQLKREEASIEN